MKNTRTVEKNGRISLPDDVRELIGVFEGDEFDIVTDGVNIILVRHIKTCLACDDDTDVQRMNKTYLCGECREAIAKTL